MSTIVFVGGHGKIALLASKNLAADGNTVRFLHNPDQANDIREAGAEPLILDIASTTTDVVVTGADSIIFTAGGGGKQSSETTFAVDRDGALKTIAAAERAGVARVLFVSYLHADDPDSVRDNPGMQSRQQAKHAADNALSNADLLWTILRPGVLSDDAASSRVAIVEDVERGTTSRANVTMLIAILATTALAARRVVDVVDGGTDIATALKQLGSR